MPKTRIQSGTAAIVGLGLVLLAGAPGRADPAAAITVSTTAQLVAALKQARGGERILLVPGTYAPFSLRGIAPASAVLVTSRDPARRAVLTGINLRGGGNLSFRDLVLRAAGTAVQEDFLFHGVRQLTLARLLVTGRPGRAGFQHDKLVQLRECSGASVTASEFTNAYIALSLLDTTGVSVTSNYFHDLRMDGVRGGGNSDVLIAYNFLTGFSPQGTDHPDAIQFWTSRQKKAAHNIAVVGNVVLRGSGNAMQGIFMRDEAGGLAYRDVRIQDNVVAGGMYNGIAVLSDTDTLHLQGNIVAAYPDQKSWIRVGSRAILQNNSAPVFLIGNKRADIVRHNRIVPPRDDKGAWAVRTWAKGRALDRYPESLRRHVDSL